MPKYKLNLEQQKAVEYTKGPLLIVAGAGTGKTTVIARKIAYLIESGLAKPEEILALTFNEKAAQEMVDRVDELLNTGYADMQISTFHAFGQRLLERHALDIGLSNQFKLLTETAAWLLVHENFDKFDLDYYRPLGNPHRHIKELLKHFSKCKDELISPEEYLEYAQNVKLDNDITGDANEKKAKESDEYNEKSRLAEIANAYHTYNQLLLDKAAFDFGDLIYYSVKLLKTRPKILADLRKRFKYILVDEFQDVNWAQYQMIRLLAGDVSLPLLSKERLGEVAVASDPKGRQTAPGPSLERRGGQVSQLTVVGDDDQSIYAFRGASVSNILRFKDDFKQAAEVVLSQNYRSGQEILDLAYKSIQNNNPDRLEVKLNIDKKLVSKGKAKKSKVFYGQLNTLNDEAKFVVYNIIKLKEEDQKATWDDFAILVRANSHTEPFISELQRRGIPYEYLSAAGLYRQQIVLDCINFFRILADHHESASLYRLLRMPFLNFTENDIQKITHGAKKKTISYYEVLKSAAAFGVSAEGINVCNILIGVIHSGLQQAKDQKPSVVLYGFLDKSGYLAYLTHAENEGNAEVIRQIYQLQQFFEYVSEYENTTSGATVWGFVKHFSSVDEAGDQGTMYQSGDTPDSVNILTAHRAKGLEFKYVFVVNLVEDRFPSRNRGEAIEIPLELIKEELPEGDSHIEEERRLFYVALTRAKERLYLTSANDYGGVRAKKISRFLAELGFGQTKTTTNTVGAQYIVPLQQTAKRPAKKSEFEYELPKAFSISQLKTYQTCPYQYKLSHVLKVPTKGRAQFSFGQTLHATLQDFYERVKEINGSEQVSLFAPAKKKAKSDVVMAPSFEELLVMYDKHWIPDWYASKHQREDYYADGKKILKTFYQTHEGKWRVPVGLESWFKIKIGNYFLQGRIDRVDQLSDGTLEIIDYKSGQAKDKLVGDDKDQLLVYQIAAEDLPEFRVLGKPSKLTFYYLNDNKPMSFLGSGEDLNELKSKLGGLIENIQARNFKATPGQFVCQHCDFKDICDFRV